jgi:glycerophosphoryl diester phosphodiesterase
MKKTFILILFQMLFAGLYCLAQNNDESLVYLTNYTISQKSNTVGQLKLKAGEIKSIIISGEHTSAFTVSKDHQLTVTPKKLKPGASWFDVTLHIKTTSGMLTETFRIVNDDFIRNKVIAHRGAWKNTGATENSIGALNHAVRLGCEGSEFDVHMSADSLPVINHDPSIQGISIAKTNSSELLTIKLSNGETLPTLENYLKAGMEQNKTKLILEIKASELGKESSLALTRKCVAIVERLRAQAWVDYISFDYDVCKEVMKRAPYAKAAYLKGDKTPAELAADNFYGLDYHFSILKKNADWIAEAKKLKLTINVWTVNEKEILEEMLKNEVDFITTNEPELLLEMVKK